MEKSAEIHINTDILHKILIGDHKYKIIII